MALRSQVVAAALFVVALATALSACFHPVYRSMRLVEVRAYTLKPGTREAYHRIATDVAIPMLQRHGIDVVRFGPSIDDDPTTYYLIRSFASLDDMRRSEHEFYTSAEWRNGPRDQILGMIEHYTAITFEAEASVIDGLRAW
jgi:hypothetical protein